MIDTVNIFHPHVIHGSDPHINPRIRTAQTPPPGYRHTYYQGRPDAASKYTHGQQQSFSCDDDATGYHAHGQSSEYKHHRASLPRLLHGSNGKLIKTQSELDAGLSLLLQKAGELGEPSTPDFHFTRVDLVWQFVGDTAVYIQAHREARHPRIRRDPTRYESRSLALEGSEMRITMYDKMRELYKHNGNIVRVEIQLKGKRLKEELGNGNLVTELDFGRCYQAYRRIMMGFTTEKVPRAGTIAELLAIGEHEGWKSGGATQFEIYSNRLGVRQVMRIREAMSAFRPVVFDIDWAEILPPDGPPPPVEIGPDGQAQNSSV